MNDQMEKLNKMLFALGFKMKKVDLEEVPTRLIRLKVTYSVKVIHCVGFINQCVKTIGCHSKHHSVA